MKRLSVFSMFGCWLPAAAFLGLLASCNLTDRDVGKEPVGNRPGSDQNTDGSWPLDSVSGNLRVHATPGRIKAGNKDRAVITARAFDGNGNPVKGKVVQFAASMGTITARDTTDSEGMATATYIPVPRNGEARIKATATVMDTATTVGTSVQLEGLSVRITPASRDTLVDNAVPVTVTVTDGDGEPVAAAAVSLQGAEDASGVTDGAGRFRTRILRGTPSQVRLRAQALGAGDSTTVGFWTTHPDSRSRTLLLFAEPARILAANGQTSRIRAVVYDGNHNPVAGRPVHFSASHGIIGPSDTTDADGAAEVTFQGVARNADALVTATVAMDDTVSRATATISLVGLQVEVRPAATEVLIGDTVPVTLRIRDAAGTPMPDVQVSLSGTLQGSARTSSAGTATAAVTAAQDRAVTVRASALGGSDSARVVFLSSLPIGSVAAKQGVGNMRVFVENSRLRASNTDETKVRVIAFDKFNNPLAGRLVRFTANHGIITATDTTDARGEAAATYRGVPLNTDARITATMVVEDSALAVITRVTLAGLEVDIRPTLTDALLNRQVPVHVRIIDGAGQPVPGATVTYNGNPGTDTTDGDGIFRASITSGIQGRVFVTAEALGSKDTSYVDFWKVLPTKGSTGEVDGIRDMRIFTSRSQLRADNSDAAQVTVILTNEKNNPAVGELVRFTSNLGIIDQTARVDSTGRATVTLRATPVNGPARVEATAVGRNLSASTEILFSGVTLQMAPDRTVLKVKESAAIEVFLRDASGNAIGGDTVKFSLTGSGATLDNGQDAYAVTLDWKGRALVRVTGRDTGTVKVKASALNMADSLELRFSNNKLTLSARLDTLTADGRSTSTLTARYMDGSGSPLQGNTITFATNAGSVSPKSVITDSNGEATTTLTSAPFAGTATVQANAPTVTAQTQVTFTTSAPTRLKLSVSADNISVNGGIATLKAVVQDSQGNMVSGRNINFRILKGPGGGEAITKPVVQALSGTATSQIQAGSVPSGYRGVMVEASLDGLADTTVLTISGAAHIVTVSRPEDDSIVVPGGGKRDESTFEFFIGAVVQDINGNYVADGTEVRFSAVVTGMALGRRILDRWEGAGKDEKAGSVKAIYRIMIQDIPFEDINDNSRLDPGIDLDLDFSPGILRRGDDRNGDGKMDWNPDTNDTWFDFNGNGACDAGVGEDIYIVRDSLDKVVEILHADLNQNGRRDFSEILIDRGTKGVCSLPTSGDYPHAFWEARDYLPFMNFSDNHFAVAIEASAVTKNGIAYARLRYPRQFSRRLYVTVNAESNGLKDRDGERFILPQIK